MTTSLGSAGVGELIAHGVDRPVLAGGEQITSLTCSIPGRLASSKSEMNMRNGQSSREE